MPDDGRTDASNVVPSFAPQHEKNQRKEVMELRLLNGDQADRLLQRLCSDGLILPPFYWLLRKICG